MYMHVHVRKQLMIASNMEILDNTPSSSSWLTLERTIGPNKFDGPSGIAIMPVDRHMDGELFVVEHGPHKASFCCEPASDSSDPFQIDKIDLDIGVKLEDLQGVCCDAPTSSVYVADAGNNCVHRLGLPDCESMGSLPKSPYTREESLSRPHAVALLETHANDGAANAASARLPDRLLCVADTGNGRVQTYCAETLAPVRSIGQAAGTSLADISLEEPGGQTGAGAATSGELRQPIGLCAHGRELFVFDAAAQPRICVFDGVTGRFLRAIDAHSSGIGRFVAPLGAAVVRGMLVVSEASRVHVLSPADGTRLHTLEIAEAGSLSGLCADPADGALVYVSDCSRGSIHRLRVGWDEGGACTGA